jgi:hypothetical protein
MIRPLLQWPQVRVPFASIGLTPPPQNHCCNASRSPRCSMVTLLCFILPGNLSRYDMSTRESQFLSNGNVAIVEYPQGFQSHQILWQTTGHSLEAWTVTYSPQPPRDFPYSLYSGGDDSALAHKLDRPDMAANCEASNRDTKTHGAGVTAILPLPIPGNRGEEALPQGATMSTSGSTIQSVSREYWQKRN